MSIDTKVLSDCIGIYFIELGNFEDIKQYFILPNDFNMEDFKNRKVYKFGKTTNIVSRLKDHISDFKKINIKLSKSSLVNFTIIEENKIKNVESLLCSTISEMFRNFPFPDVNNCRRKELAFLNSDELNRLINFVDSSKDKVFEESMTSENTTKEVKKSKVVKSESPKVVKPVNIMDSITTLTDKMNYEYLYDSSIPFLKDVDFFDYSYSCPDIGEIKQYLYKKLQYNWSTKEEKETLIILASPKGCKNFYKNVELVKNNGDSSLITRLNSDSQKICFKCKFEGEDYYVSIPRHP
jgi:hypothetical protein